MKKRIRPACLLASFALTASMFSGCGGNQPAASSASSEAASPASTSSAAGSASAAEGPSIASPSWKTDTSPYTVKWFLAYDWYGKKFNPTGNDFDKWILDETGCTLELQTGDMDKLNVLISTDSLTDIVTFNANTSQRTMLEDNDKLLPLNELRDQYAPDFVVPESMIEWYTAKDGSWYSYCNFYYGEDNTSQNNGFYETHNQNFARKDILDQIGMTVDDMRTKEGFLKALRAVKEQGIVYNGQKVIPYMGLFDDKADEIMAEQFGASRETADGKYQSIYKAPEYLEALKFYNLLYREGLMTDESFTVTSDQIGQKVAAGQVFATTRWTNVSTTRGPLYASDNNAQMLYCGLMHGDNHDEVAVLAKDNAGWAATMITKKTERPDRIIQLFAFMSQDEYSLSNEWGYKGYTLEGGHVVRDPAFKKMQDEQPAEYSAKHQGDIAWISDYTIVQGTYPEPTMVLDEDVYNRTHDDKIIIYDDKCFAATAPEAGSEEASIEARINEYVKQAVGRIVTAASEEECEKLYNETMTELENLGLSKLDAYKDTKFQENKKKLGLEFAGYFNQK